MLAMAMALVRTPRVMLFDEPTGNLSPKTATQVLEMIASLGRDLGITVVLVEQNAKKGARDWFEGMPSRKWEGRVLWRRQGASGAQGARQAGSTWVYRFRSRLLMPDVGNSSEIANIMARNM